MAVERRTFSLRSLFGVITLFGAWLAIAVRWPYVGAPFALIVLSASVETVAARRVERAYDASSWRWGDWLLQFFNSLGVMTVYFIMGIMAGGIAGGIAFSVLLYRLSSPLASYVSATIAILIGLTCFLWFAHQTWPRHRPPFPV